MAGVGMSGMMGKQGETWKEGKTQKERSGHRDTRAQDEGQGDSARVPNIDMERQKDTWRQLWNGCRAQSQGNKR